MARTIAWDDIQGNVLRGYGYDHARHLVFSIRDAESGRRWLAGMVSAVTPATPWNGPRPDTTVNIAFTHRGLAALGVDEELLDTFPEDFRQGMAARAVDYLGDVDDEAPAQWEKAGIHEPGAHILVMVHGTTVEAAVVRTAWVLTGAADYGLDLLSSTPLANLVGNEDGAWAVQRRLEHFGFADGISQPAVEGAIEPTLVIGNGTPVRSGGWRPLKPGEFVLGYPDEEEPTPPLPRPDVLVRNGSYLVVRKLSQDVAAFRRLTRDVGRRHGIAADTLAAKLVGRRADGMPLGTPPPATASTSSPPTQADGSTLGSAAAPESGGPEPASAEGPRPGSVAVPGPGSPSAAAPSDLAVLNDMRYTDDLDGRVCPVGSHIRRANPRDGMGVKPELVSRHRLLRRGMPYGPQLPEGIEDDGAERGLMFMAYCASISRQFEFVQREWMNDGNAMGVGHTADPIAGHGSASRRFACTFDDDRRPILMASLPRLVRPRSGDYLFLPSLTALQWLADEPG